MTSISKSSKYLWKPGAYCETVGTKHLSVAAFVLVVDCIA